MTPTATAPELGTRDRIVFAAAALFQRQGLTGTGLKQIAAEAEATFGSIYHFFPGGKDQLAEEVIERSGRFFAKLVGDVLAGEPDLLGGVEACFAGAAETLRSTDYADACPIACVALEVASTNERLRKATAKVMEGWVQGATAWFVAGGLDDATARELGANLIMSLEGAFLLGRATRSTEPLEVAGRGVSELVRRALEA
jgi:AcrR family transcriptional regulator